MNWFDWQDDHPTIPLKWFGLKRTWDMSKCMPRCGDGHDNQPKWNHNDLLLHLCNWNKACKSKVSHPHTVKTHLLSWPFQVSPRTIDQLLQSKPKAERTGRVAKSEAASGLPKKCRNRQQKWDAIEWYRWYRGLRGLRGPPKSCWVRGLRNFPQLPVFFSSCQSNTILIYLA